MSPGLRAESQNLLPKNLPVQKPDLFRSILLIL